MHVYETLNMITIKDGGILISAHALWHMISRRSACYADINLI